MQNNTAFDLSDADRQLLAISDDDFVLHDWEDLAAIIGISRTTKCDSISV